MRGVLVLDCRSNEELHFCLNFLILCERRAWLFVKCVVEELMDPCALNMFREPTGNNALEVFFVQAL